MAGILAVGASVPRYRLPRELLAREWGGVAAGGEKAVANHDEDSLTLAVNAALGLGGESVAPDAVFFATTTSPYAEKQAAATIAAVLDLPASVRTLDFTDTLRAATSGVLAGLDAIAGGSAARVLVAAGDCRLAEPDSPTEQSFGDAGAALLLGKDAGLAEVIATHTVADEFLGTWRTREQEFPRAFPGAFETKFGYARVVGEVMKGILAKARLEPRELATVILPAPNPRAPQAVAKAAGLDPKRQLQESFWTTLGDTGAAQPLLMLAAALERAKGGDLILVVGYGDGADAIVLRATGRPVVAAQGVARQIEVKRTLPSYGRYARFRKLVRKETVATDVSSPVILWRDRKELLPLYGGRCPKCGTVQFPKHRLCVECAYPDGLEDVKLARRGRLFTFTNDYLAESPDPPVTHAVVDLEGGGRLYVQLTDCEAERVEIDMPLELTFRKIHEAGGFNNYFWKARPQ
ncbi:MAG: hydroxymethylglutaryl-CoA synthase family protein [Deltaproteobacteria bacterium]|nr:MAG: hydroxymethylglutaryl-CoA synthase family protein [Deltaproteobacteria bacterium]